MPAFIEYLLKLSICLAVVYLFYYLFLRRLTFYNCNRWYLLGYSALSFFIPLINIMPQLQKQHMAEASLVNWIPAWAQTTATDTNIFATMDYWDWTIAVLAAGSLFFLARFLVRMYSLALIKKKATLITKYQTCLYQLDENITPFSFGNAIFINHRLHSEEEMQKIIRHEFVHVKQKHTIDILFCELLCITNWFNPFAWLIRYHIKQNLEFIADDTVVQNGFDKKEYQYLLLKVMGNQQFSFTSHFNFSSLKKRIRMMNSLKTAKVHLIKFLFLLPVVAVLLLSFRKEIQTEGHRIHSPVKKDTIPQEDTAYKISVIGSSAEFMNTNMRNTVIDRISVEDWNKNKEFYENKYGQTIAAISSVKIKGRTGNYDSVYVTRYKSKPIDPNNPPLFIIDGKESSKEQMDKINPNDIASISVLKNANAVAAYGEKGSNGVIEIITKNNTITHNKNIADTSKTLKGQVIDFRYNHQQPDSLLRIRGVSLLDGSNDSPLIVLDGKETDTQTLKNIPSNTIESITVLKDKSATEIYGDKGKNGVIEISIKKNQN